jgi:hypothetical protein
MGGYYNKKTTQISGFFLYVSTMRYRMKSELSFRDYAPIADVRYKKLTEEKKELWKQRARQLRLQDCGKAFRLTDKLLKTTRDSSLGESRENCVKTLVAKCWDLAL